MQTYFHPAFILILLSAAFVALALYYRRRTKEREAAQESIHRREIQTYEEAEADYRKALADLEDRPEKPIVLDLINDLGDDPVAELAGEAPQYLDFASAAKVLAQIRSARDDQPVHIVIHTLGGFALAAELVAAALHARKSETRAYVPYIAMSGGTLVALATEKVFIGKNAVLGPVDSQYYGFPAEGYKRLLSEKSRDTTDDHTLLRAYVVETYAREAKKKACDIVHKAHKKRPDAGVGTCYVVQKLTAADRPHSDRVTLEEAKEIGMNVDAGCPKEVYELVDARVQMIRARQERLRRQITGGDANARRHARRR